MKKVIFFFIMTSFIGCQNKSELIYQNKDFAVYSDKVVQGKFTAQVQSDGSLTSNYLSPANEPQKKLIELKFSINQKDNELPYATNHQIVVRGGNGEHTTPTITFGKQFVDGEEGANDTLEANTSLKIKLDMNPVFKSFKAKGYYEDLNGERIYKEDFNGVFVAGNITPLNFDFENLGENVKLLDNDGDHIFELTLKINTHDPDRFVKPSWSLTKDISNYPTLKTNNVLLQTLYEMSLEETVLLSEQDGTFRTGAKWAGVWTRDVSYSVVLGMGIVDIERARKSLLRKTKRSRIIQDTGSGGAWPISSDRTTWALAAWEVYLISGDQLWLDYCYQVISNTVEDDRKVVYHPGFGLYRGESSFLDWRVQTYPSWMDNVDIYSSMNLGTNMVHYKTLDILSKISELENKPKQAKKYTQWAEELKTAINKHFWLEDKGYYAQYIYGRNFMYTSNKSESLGEAFSVLFDVADKRATSVIENTPIVTWGTPCVYPQIPDMRAYHNNGIWPFVQAYWNLAAAKTGNETALIHGMSSLYRAAALFLTNKENMVAENGDFITALNSDRQLWSVAGNLSMVYKVLFGINFNPDQTIAFAPFIPQSYEGDLELSNLKIRSKDFTIRIKGHGNKIASFKLDGKRIDKYEVSLIGKGKHVIDIKMTNNTLEGNINMVVNKFHLNTPEIELNNSQLVWKKIDGAQKYEIFKNGQILDSTEQLFFNVDENNAEYTVRAMDSSGDYSFISEPVTYFKEVLSHSLKGYAKDKSISVNTSLDYMVEVSKNKNKEINWMIAVPEDGTYNISFDYANGNGRWNTDNKCAIRTLWVNGIKTSPIVMAQRGLNEWTNIGITNNVKAELKKGANKFKLTFEHENENMNIEENTALIGNMTITRF